MRDLRLAGSRARGFPTYPPPLIEGSSLPPSSTARAASELSQDNQDNQCSQDNQYSQESQCSQ